MISSLACGCPSAAAVELAPADIKPCGARAESTLGHFPVKLQLISPQAPFVKDADLLLLADCAALCHPNLHRDLLSGKVVAMACPKLDDVAAHVERLAGIIKLGHLHSLTVVHMEVPCCSGLVEVARQALLAAGSDLELQHVQIGRSGEILTEGKVATWL